MVSDTQDEFKQRISALFKQVYDTKMISQMDKSFDCINLSLKDAYCFVEQDRGRRKHLLPEIKIQCFENGKAKLPLKSWFCAKFTLKLTIVSQTTTLSKFKLTMQDGMLS